MAERELIERFADGSAKYDPNYKLGKFPKTENMLRDIASFSRDHITVALDRVAYVEAILLHGCPTPIEKKWPAIIAEVELPEGWKEHPSWYTVNRWLKKYLLGGKDPRSLIPNYKKRGRKKIDRPEEEEIFLSELLRDYLRQPGPSKTDVWKKVDAEYDKAKKIRSTAVGWTKPTKSAVFRMLDELDPVKTVLARQGEAAARAKFTLVGRGVTPTARLERVEFDHTQVNLTVVDDKRRVLGRPWITVAICCATRMVVGQYIGFEPPSDYSVSQCIRDMLSPKTYVQTVYGIKTLWNAFGPCVQGYVDNGREFHSTSFSDSAALLKMDIGYQPVMKPWFKSRIERFYGTFSSSRLMSLPGGTGASVEEKGDYNPESDACITLFEFRKLFLRWLLTDYCHRIHWGILNTPANEWEKAIKKMPLQLTDQDEIDRTLGFLTDATLTTKGLRYHYLFYVSDELQEMLHRFKGPTKVKFRLNMDHMGSITVIDPDSGHTHTALCTWPEYASSVSKWQHEKIVERCIARAKEIENEQQLIDERIVFQEELDRHLSKRKVKNKKSIARAIGGQYTNQRAKAEQEAPIYQSSPRSSAEPPRNGTKDASASPQQAAQAAKMPSWATDADDVPDLDSSTRRQTASM